MERTTDNAERAAQPNPISTTPPAESWAEVRAHNQVMRYRRAGTGRSIVLVRPELDTAALWPELVGPLGTRFRVIVPTVPPVVADIVGWLADFLEGLGVARVALVAAGDLCIPSLELAYHDPERIARAVLVPADGVDLAGAVTTLAAIAPDPAGPLLVAPRGTPSGDAVRRVTDFLEGDWTAAG